MEISPIIRKGTNAMHTIAILGATGSVGGQALDLISRHESEFRASVLSASTSAEALFELSRRFKPDACALARRPDSIPEDLRHIEWFFGPDASERALLAVKPDYALCAVVGIAGLPAVMAALDVCKRVLLANKEALVTGGELVMNRARERRVPILPVDSEHSALFQCLQGAGDNVPRRLILTASGGPFRTWNKNEIENALVGQALGHPTWNMGAKITVDCATMMNKGLEVIEAHHLFSVPLPKIDVVIHPESCIHSMVEYEDGAVLAQLSVPDMRGAIGYAMGYPQRLPFGGGRLDLPTLGKLTFEAPDEARFPCLKLARDAQAQGGEMPVALNGANEAAVRAFLDGRIRFGAIPKVVDFVLQNTKPDPVDTIERVFDADARARALADVRIEALLDRKDMK